MTPLLDYLVYLIVRAIQLIFLLLPISASSWIARLCGRLAFFVLRKRRGIALSNLDLAFGDKFNKKEKRRIARESFEHAAMSFLELFIIEKILKHARRYIKVHGKEHFDTALSLNRGLIVAMAHLGAWEYLSLYPYVHGAPGNVVVRKIKNPFLDQIINKLRKAPGISPIYKDNASRGVLSALHKNNFVAILIDQWAGPEGLWVNFFGQKTSTTSLPARLARTTNAVIISGFCIRKSPGKYYIEFKELVEFEKTNPDWEIEMTEKLNRVLEKKILAYPEQWFWAHRRWKPKPKELRKTRQEYNGS